MTSQVAEDVLSPEAEDDLSGDSAVEIKTAVWTIQSIEADQSESDNGVGRKITVELASDEWYAPITMRFFTSYTSSKGKSTDWVKKSRGQLKNLLKAATGQTNVADALDADGSNYAVGKKVTATTRDSGDGFATLGRFKKVAE